MTQTNPRGGLFAQLLPLLADRAVLITISKLEESDRLQVNICPRKLKDSENQALTTPLCVCGTAAELDAELVPQITSFVASQVGLASNLATIAKELADAEHAAREEARKKQKAASSAKKAAETTTVLPTEEKKETEAPGTLNLFDQSSVISEPRQQSADAKAAVPITEPAAPTTGYPD